MEGELQPMGRLFFRDLFREARAAADKDAEGYQNIIHAVELLGQYVLGRQGDLGKYEASVVRFARRSALATDVPSCWRQYHFEFLSLYNTMREARNDALHQGARARHLTDHLEQLAIVIEDALNENLTILSDFMVRQPVCVSPWQPVSFARQQMLINSYSYLPIWCKVDGLGEWGLLSDSAIARFLQLNQPERAEMAERRRRLALSIGAAMKEGLSIERAVVCAPQTLIADALRRFEGAPLLIVEPHRPEVLLGIVTAFDVL